MQFGIVVEQAVQDFLACGTCGTAPCLGLFYATTETSNLKCIATCPL